MRITGATVTAMLTALLSAPPSVWAVEPASGQSAARGEAITVGGLQPPRSSRLRFRTGGPACMCVSGMSDAEIEAAERQRNKTTADLERINQDP